MVWTSQPDSPGPAWYEPEDGCPHDRCAECAPGDCCRCEEAQFGDEAPLPHGEVET